MPSTKIFVVSLQTALARREAIKRKLDQFNLNYEIVDATYGKHLPDHEKKDLNPERNLKDGEIGCYLSHIRCYELMLQQGLQQCIILEDDTHIGETFAKLAREPISGFNFDLLFLLVDDKGAEGDVFHIEDTKQEFGGFAAYQLTSGPYSTNAYVVNADWARYRLETKAPFSKPIDHYTGLHRKPTIYGIDTSICFLSEGAVTESMISADWSPLRKWVQQLQVFYIARDMAKLRSLRKWLNKKKLESKLQRPLTSFRSGFRVI